MKTGSANHQNSSQLGGFPCPRCKNMIQFPLQALLQQSSIFCSHCGLELEIDVDHSSAALADLRRYSTGLDEAQRILDGNKPA